MSISTVLIEQDIEEAFAIYDWFKGFSLLREVIAEGAEVDEELVFRAIEIAVELRKSQDAKEFLNEYLKMVGEATFEYFYFTARIARMEKRYLDAIIASTTALEATDEPIEQMLAYSVRSGAYDAIADYALAIKDYEQVLRINPNWYVGRCLYAWALFNSEDYAKACTQFTLVQETSAGDPEVSDCTYGLGLAEFMQGHFHEAIEAFNVVAQMPHPDVNAFYYRGLAYLETSMANYQTQFAVADFQQVLELVPEHPHALARIGDCHFKMEQFVDAINIYNTTEAEHPLAVRSQLSRAWAYYFLAEEPDEYQIAYDSFVKIITKDKAAFYEGTIGMAQSAYCMHDYPHVLALIESILAIDPTSAQGNPLKGWTLYKQGETLEEYRAAHECFQLALTTQPENSDALRGRANCAKMLHDFAAALEDFTLLADPDDIVEVAWLKGCLGQHYVAITVLEAELLKHPEDLDIYDKLATLYRLAKAPEDVERILEQMLKVERTGCGLVQYADVLRQRRSDKLTEVEIYALYEEAYALQRAEELAAASEDVCDCARAKIIHCNLTAFGITRDDDKIIDLLLEGIEVGTTNIDFLLLYAYIFTHGIGVEPSAILALHACERLVARTNDVLVSYVYACLAPTAENIQALQEKMLQYGNLTETWVITAIEAQISAGTFEFFYPLR